MLLQCCIAGNSHLQILVDINNLYVPYSQVASDWKPEAAKLSSNRYYIKMHMCLSMLIIIYIVLAIKQK